MDMGIRTPEILVSIAVSITMILNCTKVSGVTNRVEGAKTCNLQLPNIIYNHEPNDSLWCHDPREAVKNAGVAKQRLRARQRRSPGTTQADQQPWPAA